MSEFSGLFKAIIITVVGVYITLASDAFADSQVALSWTRGTGAKDCPGSAQVARVVQARLGREVFVAPTEANLFIEAEVSGDERGLTANIVIFDSADSELGRRVLSSDEGCPALLEQVIVILSMLIDPTSEFTEPEKTTENDPPTTPIPKTAVKPKPVIVPVVDEPEPPGPEHSEPKQASFESDASVVVGIGAQTMLGAAVRFRVNSWRLGAVEVEGTIFPEIIAELPDGRGASLTIGLLGMHLCPLRQRYSSNRVSGCIGVEAGSLQARSFGTNRSQDVDTWLLNGAFTGRFSRSIGGGLQLHGAARLVVPTQRPKLQVAELGNTFDDLVRLPPVYVVLDAGIGLRF